MYDVATAAVEAALTAGARYADARVMESRSEVVAARNGHVELVDRGERAGVGVRALIGSSWGFFAVPDPSPAGARLAGERAAAIARASARVAGPAVELVPVPPATGSWASPCEEDPWGVPLDEKAALLEGVTQTMQANGADTALATSNVWETRKWLVSARGPASTSTSASAGPG